MKAWKLFVIMAPFVSTAAFCQAPSPINSYSISSDGGIVYTPLSRESAKTGQAKYYDNAQTVKTIVCLDGITATFDVPKSSVAYDVVPIRYMLSWNKNTGASRFPIALEATAFENESRRRGRDLHDLNLPGKIDLKVEYLGSVTAHLVPGSRNNIKPNMTDKPGSYPGFKCERLVRSGVVEAGDLIWFKFKYTNTGNTILDPEGAGGWEFCPEIQKLDDKGKWQVFGRPYNLYYRDLTYIYPGESREIWFQFQADGSQTPQSFGLRSGEYKIIFRAVARDLRSQDTYLNLWEGSTVFSAEQPIRVEDKSKKAVVKPIKVTLTDGPGPDKITRWIHSFEEFMTAFDCHIKKPEGSSISGTLNLQVAPWTKQVVVKLISAGNVSIKTAAVPINVDSESLKVRFNPDNTMCIVRDGKAEPIIFSQTMADMRANVQIGPYPERHIADRLKEMMDCGVNLISMTSMPWLYDDFNNPLSNHQGDAWKYVLDLSRKYSLAAEAWGAYPYDRATICDIAGAILGRKLNIDTYQTFGYPAVSHADPNTPVANAAVWLYQFHRWGDLFYESPECIVPIGVEDTRGWLRQDINMRYQMGELSWKSFQNWTKSRYLTIDAVNAAWESTYKSFDEILPAKVEVSALGDLVKPFMEWGQAIADLDEFRTIERAKNYQDTLRIVRNEIPNAYIDMRTEGANVLVDGISPDDPNPHFRHIYYSQRRCALMVDILRKSGTIKFHSDYTTMPYTPCELRKLVRMSVEQGIIPMYMPQFDNMRDIAINDTYGTDYTRDYNISGGKNKGCMMHVLTAVYPWFKAVYEEGGCPGILWEDYQCDGFATVTQKAEMKFFKNKLDEALAAPEAKKWAETLKTPASEWKKGSKALKSFDLKDL